MAVRFEPGDGGRCPGFGSGAGRAVRAAWLLVLLTAFGYGSGAGQGRSQLGTITAAGRVTYFVVHTSPRSPWTVAASAGRGLTDGDWESVALDVARRLWRSEGGHFGARAIARHDRLKTPRGGTLAAEAVWHATPRLILSGSCAAGLDADGGGGPSLRFHAAGTGVKVQVAESFALTAAVRYEAARGSFRTELGLRAVR